MSTDPAVRILRFKHLADFIVICEVNGVENTLLQDTAKDKEIIDIQDINDVKGYARRVTLKKCKYCVK